MGSDSDLRIMKDAAEILEHFDISYDLTIVSAHRTPERMFQYGLDAGKKGIKVIIAGAGGAAHLPGMIASLTSIPVIGVPIKGSRHSSIGRWKRFCGAEGVGSEIGGLGVHACLSTRLRSLSGYSPAPASS